jgi:hypothetical protein
LLKPTTFPLRYTLMVLVEGPCSNVPTSTQHSDGCDPTSCRILTTSAYLTPLARRPAKRPPKATPNEKQKQKQNQAMAPINARGAAADTLGGGASIRSSSSASSSSRQWRRLIKQHRWRGLPVPTLLSGGVLLVLATAFAIIALTSDTIRQPAFAHKPVALRFVIISAGSRLGSLYRLLHSLCLVLNEGDRLDLDVWFDIPEMKDPALAAKDLEPLTNDINRLGLNGTYRHGYVRARAWNRHMGLRGQWLEAWPESIPGGLKEDTKEVGLILEDDLELSPYSWRWLKAAIAAYGSEERVAGFTLQRASLCAAKCPNIVVGGPGKGAGGAFLYPLVGTWGYAPTAKSFSRFRQWYYSLPLEFKPYVDGLSPTEWYRNFEKKGTEKLRMWTMHHIKYTDTHPDRYTVYPNYYKDNSTFSANHRESGLNFNGKEKQGSTHDLLLEWDDDYVQFAKSPVVWNLSAVAVEGEGLRGGTIGGIDGSGHQM